LYNSYQQRLNRLLTTNGSKIFHGGRKGIEKESLRTTSEGYLAQTPHPTQLGAALTHPNITTDYSEALLELVTAPHKNIRDAIQELDDIHHFVYANLGGNLLWNASMPCIVHGESAIPIARYGRSNAAKMKEVYRLGLGHRYGRVMQAIAGVHFNYSLPDHFWPALQTLEKDTSDSQAFRSAGYFRLIRNYLRHDWLTLYLFGASPALCVSFFTDHQGRMFQTLDEHTVFEPYGTTLRMSDIGYQNKPGLDVSLNHVAEYVDSLNQAVATPHPPFSEIGVQIAGEYRQISDHILQIANEYYNAIRPKQIMKAGERPTTALANRGVQYVEVRSLDINPLDPIGVNEDQLRFTEMLLIFCALQDSPEFDQTSEEMIRHNQRQVALYGRQPDLPLTSPEGEKTLQSWAGNLMQQLKPLAASLDEHEDNIPYQQALNTQQQKVENPNLTPSAIMLRKMREQNLSFYGYAIQLSKQWQDRYAKRPLSDDVKQHFTALAQTSHAKQAEIEAADDISFDQYLANYFSN